MGNWAIYFDIDSIKFMSRPGKPDLSTGKFIGERTDEPEGYGVGSYFTESISGRLKNYADKIWSKKDQTFRISCKVKGLSLNFVEFKLVSFDSIKNMVLKNLNQFI